MLGNDAMEFLKTLHKLDNIWNEVEDAEYNDRQLTQFAERYHEHKLKLLGIAIVSGTAEHHCGNKITEKELFHDHCLKCGEYFSED